MKFQVSRLWVSACITLVELDDPPDEVRVVFWQIIHVTLNKKGNFKSNILEVQLHARVKMILNVRNRYQRIVVNNHTLQRSNTKSN